MYVCVHVRMAVWVLYMCVYSCAHTQRDGGRRGETKAAVQVTVCLRACVCLTIGSLPELFL